MTSASTRRGKLQFGTLLAVFVSLTMLATFVAPSAGAVSTTASPLQGAGWESAASLGGNYLPASTKGSMYTVAQVLTGAADYWEAGYTGAGIDIALIDSGVVPVNGLTYPGKVINAIDLSFESQAENLQYLDTYGHGTHMAGIIAGRDNGARIGRYSGAAGDPFLGMAPGARIVNVKVADHEGSVDVSQVIAAIDWVVQHRRDNGMNIRVIALAYGTDGDQKYISDPLAFAVERAWKAGIVVVAAAGNDGNRHPLRNPAYDPFVIAVGAIDSGDQVSVGDDIVTSFSNCGTTSRHVDLVAPGRSIISLRNPGSEADLNYSSAVVADRFFLGSGTSQATAVVAGAAALVLDQRPSATPDEVKVLLMKTARPVPEAPQLCQGAGELNLEAALTAPDVKVNNTLKPSKGNGTLEGSRGSIHLEADGVRLQGEQDIFGAAFVSKEWAKLSANGVSWSGGEWNGNSWSGNSWSGNSWSGNSWSGVSWSGVSWSGVSWSGVSWSGNSWSGVSWSGSSWSGVSWSGSSWSGASWSSSNQPAEAGLSWE